MSLHVVRAFVGLRELMASNAALARKLNELERKYKHHDEAIAAILSGHPQGHELACAEAPRHRIYRRYRVIAVPLLMQTAAVLVSCTTHEPALNAFAPISGMRAVRMPAEIPEDAVHLLQLVWRTRGAA